MIELRTGLPGSGKTLSLIEAIVAYRKEGRRVFVEGIRGLDFAATGAEPYTAKLSDWATALESGDVLVVDEVQRFLPKGMTTRSTPAWVEELTRNRHLGVDLLFATQDALNIDAFVRRLVNTHRHYVNLYGGQKAKVYFWQDGVHEPDKAADKKKAEASKWKYPVARFPLYKSAELHTRKGRIPKAVKWAAAGAVACVMFAAAAWWVMGGLGKHSAAAVSSVPAKVDPRGSGALVPTFFGGESGKERHYLSKQEWFARMEPRVPGVYWSEPLFDERKAVSQPELYCMSVDNGTCKCISEQGTDVQVSGMLCREIALHGMYNPFKAPAEKNNGFASDAGQAQSAQNWQGRLPPVQQPLPPPPLADSQLVASPGGDTQRFPGHKSMQSSYDASVFRGYTTQYR